MKPELLAAISAAVAAIVAAGLTYRSSSQANQISNKKVDAEAYDRGKQLYEGALNLAERQIAQLREQIDRLATQLNDEREVSTKLRQEMRILQDTIAHMERELARMRTRMQQAGLDPGDSQVI